MNKKIINNKNNKDIIVYKNKLESRIINISIGIIYIPLFCYILINDLITQSEHFLNNLKYITVIGLVVMIPIIIINRFKIIFDYKNKIIKYRSYFKLTKTYNFDDITIIYKKAKGNVLAFEYIFYYNNKKIFKLDDISFVDNTKESIDYLKELFSGTEKEIFNLEKNLRNENVEVTVYNYSKPNIFFIISINDSKIIIDVGYDSFVDDFLLEVKEQSVYTEGYQKFIESEIIDKRRCKLDELYNICYELTMNYIAKE